MRGLSQLHRGQFCQLALFFAFAGGVICGSSWGAEERAVWGTDYREGLADAKSEKTMLLLWFFDPQQADENAKWEEIVLSDPNVQEQLERLTLVKLPID